MKLRVFTQILLFLCLPATAASAAPRIVESRLVRFPGSGRVIVQAREERGKFPQMLFISEKTGRVLLRSEIRDERDELRDDDNPMAPADLRFRTVRGERVGNPLIMSLAAIHGGSDGQYFMTVFGEVNGKISRFNKRPLTANIQGGFYIGYLNRKQGYGLAAWSFIWGEGAHYSPHRYQMDIYRLEGGKLRQTISKESKKKYEPEDGANSLRELGIKVLDQRGGIPGVILE